ncbi:hydantoinase/oxoprolinase family protein [Alphaproteobacteria bacterium]|nr:hydantoinase/oxoprolinase family protein [Alphaproteobacteria bacterium]
MTTYRLGADIGGTFTDIILLAQDGALLSKKVLSTPDDYSRAIGEGVQALLAENDVSPGQIAEVAHATTIATNAIIERRGARVALITTQGFRDVLELARFRSPHLYDIEFRKPEPLVERRLRFEVAERIGGDGNVLQPLDVAGLDAIAERIVADNIEAVAICFINAYVNADHENAAMAHLQKRLPNTPISTSSQLLPQIQEFERTSTTVVNAYLRPVVEHYVSTLSDRIREIGVTAPLMIMQSNGGVLPASLVGANPVYIIESGPAAGVVGAQRLGVHLGIPNLMVLDMGGTTAKASIIEKGEITIMPGAEVGMSQMGNRLIQGAGYPIQAPTIDIAEVGAGGGSIAWIDGGGGVHVGPRSAGAIPGPVCYDQGGDQPTVTDANMILGYLNPNVLVGGDLPVNFDKAAAAIDDIGAKLGQERTEMAYGVHLIANATMYRALSGVTSEKGRDPSQFDLLTIGGNGGVHAAGLADTLNIKRIIVPPAAGLFSAMGLSFADVEHHLVRGFYHLVSDIDAARINETAVELVAEAETLLIDEGFGDPAQRDLQLVAEVKYFGQSWALPIVFEGYPVTEDSIAVMLEAFGTAHDQNYGYRSDEEPTQIVALKLIGRGVSTLPRLPDRVARVGETMAATAEREAYFGPELGWHPTPVLPREGLSETSRVGPLIIEEYDTTTVVRPGWSAHLDEWNNIVLERE